MTDQTDASLDKHISELMSLIVSGQFEQVGGILKDVHANLSVMPILIPLATVRVTFSVRHLLPDWQPLVLEIRERHKDLPNIDRLMQGLIKEIRV